MSTKTDQKVQEKGWEKVQIKAFTSWINGYLEKRNLEITDITHEMDDGVRLINFLELLSEKKIKQRYTEKPPTRIQKIENLHIALSFLEKEMEMKSNASAENFADHSTALILGFFWTLFKRYRIQTIKHEGESSEAGLLLWVKKTTEEYPEVTVESYRHSFRNGLAFLALCDKYVGNPEVIDYGKFSKDNAIENLTAAFEVAEKEIGIPKLLEPEEVFEGNVDERSLVLYISLYFHAFVAKEQQKGIQEEKDRMENEMKGLQGTLQERAQMASRLQTENEELKERLAQLEEQLANETAARERLEKELSQRDEELKEEQTKRKELEATQVTLEGQVSGLQEQVAEWTSKWDNAEEQHKKEKEERESRAAVEVKGLEVLKKNLEEHVEDLYHWQRFLDLEGESEVDFSGEIRPQLLLDISSETFDKQLEALAQKLEKENGELTNFLKAKEAEKKAKKEAEKKKKQRQSKV